MTTDDVLKVPPASRRMPWLDIIRGVALLAMASYHFLWDLSDFGYLDAAYPSTGWPRIYARIIASTFLFLAGFSLVLTHGKAIRWNRFWYRLGVIVAAAALVTIGTYFAMPQGWIYFGILHAMALTSLIGLLFLRVNLVVPLIVAAAAFAAPLYLKSETFNAPWFWWLGLSTKVKPSFDYVPILPWLAPFLLGIVVARLPVTTSWLRQKAPGDSGQNRVSRLLSFLGRHSLVFYLVHQPILISLLYGALLAYPAPPQTVQFTRSCEAGCRKDESAEFCTRFCSCALDSLVEKQLLVPLQSGTMSEGHRDDIDKIRTECTVWAE